MGIDKKSLTHICNVIRRHVQQKFPDFSPVFILHEGNNRAEAIQRESRLILMHPAGQDILDVIRSPDPKMRDDNRTRLVGLVDSSRQGDLRVLGRRQMMAVFFINTERLDSEFMLRSQLWHLIWHGLALRQDYLKREGKKLKKSGKPIFLGEPIYEIKDNIVRPKLSGEKLYQQNLMADIFAASVQFLEGDVGAIKAISAMRMKDSLYPIEGYIAERYPYAVCHETLEFVFENNSKMRNKKSKAIQFALTIAHEIGENYSIPSTQQWKNFCFPAQHMAWAGLTPETVLGTAIYTSENPYVRSIGDMIADLTKIEPDIITNIEGFNPFVNLEKAIEVHKKTCHDSLRKLLLNVSKTTDMSFFYEEARKHNERLQAGDPYGWSAGGLIALAETYGDKFADYYYDKDQIAKAHAIFEKEQEKIPYETLLRFSVLIFQRRRMGSKMEISDVIKLASMNDDFKQIKIVLEKSQNADLKIPETVN